MSAPQAAAAGVGAMDCRHVRATQASARGGGAVIDGHLVTGGGDMACHGVAHDTQARETRPFDILWPDPPAVRYVTGMICKLAPQ